MVFHDDFLTLFPKYWALVPPNYEYISVGMIPRHFNVSKEAVYGRLPLYFLASMHPVVHLENMTRLWRQMLLVKAFAGQTPKLAFDGHSTHMLVDSEVSRKG